MCPRENTSSLFPSMRTALPFSTFTARPHEASQSTQVAKGVSGELMAGMVCLLMPQSPPGKVLPLELIEKLPKTDLHVLLDGSLRLSTILDLSEKQRVELPAKDEDGLRKA